MTQLFTSLSDDQAQHIAGGAVIKSVNSVSEPTKGEKGTWSFQVSYTAAPSENANVNSWYNESETISGKKKYIETQYSLWSQQVG